MHFYIITISHAGCECDWAGGRATATSEKAGGRAGSNIRRAAAQSCRGGDE